MIRSLLPFDLCLLTFAFFFVSSCGYHVAGKADLLPKTIHTIAIPAFANATTRSRLAERLPAALTREFLSRTRYRIVADPSQADATLTGALVNYTSYATVFDQRSSRATGVQVVVAVQITLRDRAGAVLYTRPHLEFRERYEISVDQRAFFEESEPAQQRLSGDVARTVVSAILENF
jgi:outer membrane lipopolysaccharide assembly protein LptE/RlpB